jgi:hypothetical protein
MYVRKRTDIALLNDYCFWPSRSVAAPFGRPVETEVTMNATLNTPFAMGGNE